MALLIARIIVAGLAAYGLAGVVVALLATSSRLRHIDRAAAGSSLGFRLLIAPSLIALWPVVLGKWRRSMGGAEPHVEDNTPPALSAHLKWWLIVTPLLMAALILALVNR